MLKIQYFPKKWKLAIISMVYKTGKPENQPSSYRPISLLPALSKVWERLLLTRIAELDIFKAALPNHQFGFRSGHGTIEQVHRVVNHILKAYDQREYCNAVFVDIQEAFDRVWPPNKVKNNFASTILFNAALLLK